MISPALHGESGLRKLNKEGDAVLGNTERARLTKLANLKLKVKHRGDRSDAIAKTAKPIILHYATMTDFPAPEIRFVALPNRGSDTTRCREGRQTGTHDFGPAHSASIHENEIRPIMNRHPSQHELIVSGIHLELTPSLKNFVQQKVDRLFRHEERILRIRVELECDPKQSVATRFCAKGHISIHGPDLNASVSTDECHKAVAMLVDKLDRMLQRRAQMYKAKRHRTPVVDIDAALSKVG